jgi:hypothetical protein
VLVTGEYVDGGDELANALGDMQFVADEPHVNRVLGIIWSRHISGSATFENGPTVGCLAAGSAPTARRTRALERLDGAHTTRDTAKRLPQDVVVRRRSREPHQA